MNKPDQAPRWYQPWRRTEGSVPCDPADLGTCFGLEATLAADPVPAKTSAAPSRRLGWMQRFTSRRRASL